MKIAKISRVAINKDLFMRGIQPKADSLGTFDVPSRRSRTIDARVDGHGSRAALVTQARTCTKNLNERVRLNVDF